MPSRPANVSLIHRRCSGPSTARGREDNPSTEPHPLTFCSMSELVSDESMLDAPEPLYDRCRWGRSRPLSLVRKGKGMRRKSLFALLLVLVGVAVYGGVA